MSSDKVIHLSEDSFDHGVSSGVTLVDFWAQWCAPCVALAPLMDELAEEYDGKLRVAKVDIDSNPNIPAKLGIRGIPTLMVFKDGEQVDVLVGNSPQQVRDMVKRAL